MKKFKFNFTKAMLGFIYAGIALSVIAFGANTYFVISEATGGSIDSFYTILRFVLMYLVSVLLFVVLSSLLASSYYEIKGTTLKTSFGIIKSKYDVEKIEAILLDRNNGKLSVYFEDKSFIVIAVKEEWYEDFISALLKVNPKIDFSIKSKENSPDDDLKKK